MSIARRIIPILAISTALTTLAASPPDLLNYQGVLRDAADTPLDGTYDMIFSFHNFQSAGEELLVDRHLAANGQAVTVSGGLFNVALGSGELLDGSGSGTYTTLASLFGDRTDLWLQVQVGAEVLTPRVRVSASGFALNARYVDGRDPAEFLDDSAATQVKSGNLVAGAGGVTSGTGSDWGIEGYGTSSAGGGYFENLASGCNARLGDNGYGILTQCQTSGGRFENTSSGAFADLGTSGYGVQARGPFYGAYFQQIGSSDFVEIAGQGSGIVARGTVVGGTFVRIDSSESASLATFNAGVEGHGTFRGGLFTDVDNSGYAHVGTGDYGIRGYGNAAGGYFEDEGASGYAEVGTGDYGIRGFGNTAGGYFKDQDGSGYSEIGIGEYGIRGYGNTAGARFEDLTSSSFTLLANGDTGILGYGNFQGGYFLDLDSNSYGRVGYSIYKIFGSGTVSFAQNHPDDPEKVVVYHAPESSEVSVYTRGRAVLEDGLARVPLDETFRLVANPDLGLTAHLTPRGTPASLAVESVSATELVVRGPEGSDTAFDYMVWGLRIGFEEAAPVQPKSEESYIPSMAGHREMFRDDGSLRRFSALERYSDIEARVRGIDRGALDLSRARALKARIGEYDDPSRLERGDERLVAVPAGETGAGTDDGATRSPQAAGEILGPRATIVAAPPAGSAAATVPDGALWMSVAEPVRRADLLVVTSTGLLEPAASMADPRVVGVAAGPSRAAAGGGLEAPLSEKPYTELNVDAGFGAIRPGDLLVASPTAGHAMRALETVPGTIVGKALDGLESGTGTIRVLLTAR